MSMSDIENGNGNGNDERRITGRDLEQHGLKMLDVSHYDQMPVANEPKRGEISNVDWMKVFDLGKALAAFQDAMPPHCRGKWGICSRIAANAVQWQMDPFGIADQTYVVSGRLAYMSQLIHALIERRAPLQHRLECEYTGEGQERQCTISGLFISGDVREYTSPKVKDIAVKNSPLWKNDPDQQLFYFAVRSWGRKWVPDVLLGVYTKEELEADRSLGFEQAEAGLHARLKGSPSSDEGHRVGHAAEQLDQIENSEEVPDKQVEKPQQRVKSAVKLKTAPKAAKRTSEPPKAKAKQQQADTAETPKPSNVSEYLAYARRWIKAESDSVTIGQRWASERSLRNKLGVTSEDRAPLDELIKRQIGK